MTGLDFITAILFMSGVLIGLYRGFVASLGDIAAIGGGLIITSFTYTGPVTLLRQFDITGLAVELVCFLATALFFILALLILIETLKKRVDIKHIVDRLFGIATGIVQGFIFSGFLFFIMSSSFNAASEVEKSNLPGRVIRYMPAIYERAENSGVVIPKMIYLPENYEDEFDPSNTEIRFSNTRFSSFEGFKCMECGEDVVFEGYFQRIGATFIPKVTCSNCGRTSDGCQTYEGFHNLYGRCPIDVVREKHLRLDCGRWPNERNISPPGPCPIDSNTLELWIWEPPSRY